jgi:hypothetical protein
VADDEPEHRRVRDLSEEEERTMSKKLRGRKAGKMEIKIPGPDGGSSTRLDVEIRIDVEKGDVLCEVDAQLYTADTIDELKKLVADALAASQRVTWKRYLLIDYSAQVKPRPSRTTWYHGSETVGLDADNQPEPDAETYGVTLRWREAYLSSPFVAPGDDKPHRLEARVNEHDGSRGSTLPDRKSEKIPRGAILWSPERLAFLEELRGKLGHLDRRMRQVFVGERDEVEANIDRLGVGQQFLLAGERAPR